MVEARVYDFKPVRRPVLDRWIAEEIIRWEEGRPYTIRLPGLKVTVEKHGEVAVFRDGSRVYEASMHDMEEVAGSDKMYMLTETGLVPLEVRRGGYYKLLPVARGKPPTLEINGIHMHRTSGTDPDRDTRAKIRAARIKRGVRVLDTCMGLGYTAIYSARRGASHVLTVEVDDAVLYLAERNPWSWPLGDEGITVVHGSVLEVVEALEDESFDRIIHDPPRFTSSTGDLYGLGFYRELYRILRPGGILFHYTGRPGRLRRINLPGRVASRLEKAGFEVVGFDERALGVVAFKPR